MLTYSSDRHSELNTARWYYQMSRTMRRYANKGYGSMSAATRHWNIARARLIRAIKGTKPAERYDADLTTTIAGIPCGIVITYYSAPKPWRQHTFKGAGPGDCDPPEDEDVEFFVIDRKGYPAEWLERKADYQDLKQWVLENIS